MRYKVSLNIGFSGATQEEVIDIPDEELAECSTDEEREELEQGYYNDWANNYIDGGIWPAEDE